jgi:putative heme iron utilization protein
MRQLPSDVVERIRAELAAHPDAMMLEVSRRHGVPEYDVLALIGAPRAVVLDAARWEEILKALTTLGNVRVLVSNSGITMEARGTFGGFSQVGDYFNVQTSTLDLHLRWAQIVGAMALEKPSHLSGRPTASVQFFDGDGTAIMKVFLLFGERADDTDARRAAFHTLRETFAL